jgi:hypothetical protein
VINWYHGKPLNNIIAEPEPNKSPDLISLCDDPIVDISKTHMHNPNRNTSTEKPNRLGATAADLSHLSNMEIVALLDKTKPSPPEQRTAKQTPSKEKTTPSNPGEDGQMATRKNSHEENHTEQMSSHFLWQKSQMVTRKNPQEENHTEQMPSHFLWQKSLHWGLEPTPQ